MPRAVLLLAELLLKQVVGVVFFNKASRAVMSLASTCYGIIEYQLVTKKVMFYSNFFVKIFGQFAKKQYLCSRFRAYCK